MPAKDEDRDRRVYLADRAHHGGPLRVGLDAQ